ncbi:MAG TPA: hypothetical protein VGM94_02390 [Galbitalea sp.]|jgi:hypothetical protein
MSSAVKTRSNLRPASVEKSVKPTRSADIISIGGSPRVSLLPPEVHARGRARVVRRRLGIALIGAIALVVIGVGLASVSLISAQAAQRTAQNASDALLSQQTKFSAVTRVQADVAAIKTAQVTGAAPEVAWQPFIKEIEGTLPSGMTITGVKGALSTGTAGAVIVPLQGPHVATIEVTVSTPQNSISQWLNQLPTLTGFVDATPGSVTRLKDDFTVDVTIHIDKDALANRFPAAK